MPNLALDQEIASKVASDICEKLVPLGLPFVIIIGIPNEGGTESRTIRACCGMKDERNREFMRDKFEDYLGRWERGEIKPNSKFEPS